jgi:hypothetical protein
MADANLTPSTTCWMRMDYGTWHYSKERAIAIDLNTRLSIF